MIAEAPTIRRNRRKTLTDRMVAALPRKRSRYFHPDPEQPGHGVRVLPDGPSAFYVITRDPFKKQRWVRIAGTAELTIAESRETARAVIKRVRAGLDPFEPPPTKPDSVADVVDQWITRHVRKNGMRTADEIERVIRRYVLPAWRDRVFAEIKRSDITRLLDAVEDKHGAWVADSVLAQLRAVATWYAGRSDDYVPPFTRGMRRVSHQKRQRDRVLDDDELRKVWRAAEADDAGPFGAFVRLLLLSAQRRDKVAALRWDDVASDGTWTIRTEDREKGNAGMLRLPPQAMAIIAAQPRFEGSPFVFTAVQRPGQMAGLGSRLGFLQRRCGVDGWHLHDLRRTARSLMSRAKIPSDIAERVLGHARRGVEGVYDRHSYADEKADALRWLAALVEAIVHPPAGNVVPMRSAP
jgi:integrase